MKVEVYQLSFEVKLAMKCFLRSPKLRPKVDKLAINRGMLVPQNWREQVVKGVLVAPNSCLEKQNE
jgi:hypothetical protein